MENKKIILEIKNLHKDYPVLQGLILPKEVGRVQAVNQISFQLYQGETLGIIGESGCGKSVTALSLMALTGKDASISAESEIILFDRESGR